MKTSSLQVKSFVFLLLCFSIKTISSGQEPMDIVGGNLIQFNDNGAWCWYQDERAVIDTAGEILIIGSDASGNGYGGSNRDGHVEGSLYNMETRELRRRNFRNTGCDDHNAPAFLVRPDGQYLVMYADHYDGYSRYRLFNGTNWLAEQQFDWSTIPGGTDYYTTYSNLFYLPAEDKVYNFARCYARSPNMIVSIDQGSTWEYSGLLTEPDVSIGYVNGYFKYSGNGYDRIDFVATEHHPRDYNTSIYHGYILNGQSFNSEGDLMDVDITDKNAPTPADFTLVFAANSVVQDITMTRCWNIDIQHYNNDTIAILFKARANNSEMDHRYFYARYDGNQWTSTYLCKAGWKLYNSEQDYVGLGALDPHNPNIIYISTPFDPRDDSELGVREIYKGESLDQGATWTWTPITQHSTRNNYRPIVPAWDGTNTALLWMRGTYSTAQIFDMTIVGLIDRPYETYGLMSYVDATTANTFLSDNSPFIPTGPDEGPGSTDNLWHERTGYGNGGSVFTSAEAEGEDAPTLKTVVKASDSDSFNVWVNFWADPEADWRIEAGLDEDHMQVFRHMACKQVDEDIHTTSLVLSGDDNTFLYQAYLGKVTTASDSTFEVFIDDEAVETGTSGTLIGDLARTWYDGISYTKTLYVSLPEQFVELEDTVNSIDSFRIFSNTGWSVSASDPWISLSLPGGTGNDTIHITAEENSSGSARETTIFVSADSIESQVVRVFQKASNPSLTVSDETMTIGAQANSTATFNITSNTFWQISSSEAWLTADRTSGINNAEVLLKAALNPDNVTREATVSVSATGLETQTITVTQEAYVLLGVTTNTLTIGATASSTATFNVISNTTWSLDINESWLSANALSGTGKTTITLTADENNLNETREAIINVSADGADDQIVTVTQLAPNETAKTGNPAEVYVYPNPARNILNIELSVFPATISLFSLEGRELLTRIAKEKNSEIDMTHLEKGLYIVHITTLKSDFIFRIIKD